MTSLENLSFRFETDVKRMMILRAEQAIEHLLGAIQEGYYEVMVGSRGAAGSVGALQTQLKIAEGFIEGIIGFGKLGDYLKFTEYGVKPAGKYPAHSKVPPASAFAEWIRRARLTVPERFRVKPKRTRINKDTKRQKPSKRRASINGDDEARSRLRWAWAMVLKRKRYGYRGLKVIERVAREQENAIRTILQGLS